MIRLISEQILSGGLRVLFTNFHCFEVEKKLNQNVRVLVGIRRLQGRVKTFRLFTIVTC